MIMLTTNLIAMRSKIKCNVMPRPVFWLSKNTEKLAMKRLSSKPENVTFRNKRGQVSIDCLDFDKSIEHSVYAIGVFVNKWGRPTSSFFFWIEAFCFRYSSFIGIYYYFHLKLINCRLRQTDGQTALIIDYDDDDDIWVQVKNPRFQEYHINWAVFKLTMMWVLLILPRNA